MPEGDLPSLERMLAGLSDSGAKDVAAKVDVRPQGNSLLVVVRPVNALNPFLYRVINNSAHHTLYFRQSDCEE